MTEFLRNKRASALVFTAVIVLVFAMIISAVMYVAYVSVQTTVIRNAMKTGLANLAYTISEDTYIALRVSDFDEYADRLTSRSSYRATSTRAPSTMSRMMSSSRRARCSTPSSTVLLTVMLTVTPSCVLVP